jgi:hypothetical protein
VSLLAIVGVALTLVIDGKKDDPQARNNPAANAPPVQQQVEEGGRTEKVGNSSAAKAPPGRLPSPEGPIRSAPPPRNEPPKINPPKEDPPKSGEPKTEPPKVDPQVDLPDPKIDDDWPTLPPRKRPAERAESNCRALVRPDWGRLPTSSSRPARRPVPARHIPPRTACA